MSRTLLICFSRPAAISGWSLTEGKPIRNRHSERRTSQASMITSVQTTLHPAVEAFARPLRAVSAIASCKSARVVLTAASKQPQPIKLVQDESLPSDAEVVPLRKVGATETTNSQRYGKLRAVVAGATGKTGRALVNSLIQKGVGVKALTRDMSKAAELFSGSLENVQLVRGNIFQFASLSGLFENCNTLFIAVGSRPSLDPLGPFNVDYQGTVNLITAAEQQGVKKVILVTSIGVDDTLFPLNLFFGILFWKKRAEESLQRSGLDYTIVRPGGLTDAPRGGRAAGNVVLGGPDTFGLPPRKRPGSILRSQVAEICIEAAVLPAASFKVVEAIADEDSPRQNLSDLFASI